MTLDRATRRAASAVHERARRLHAAETRHVELALIQRMTADGMIVELGEEATSLKVGENLWLADHMHWWETNYGFRPGDMLVVVELSDHTWVAFGVLSERDVRAGIRPTKPPAAAARGLPHPPLDSATDAGLLSASSSAVPAGGGTPTITLTWNHHIVKKMEVYDAAGTRIGWVPVFSTLP